MPELCEARDEDAGLTCVLPEDHVGGHYDQEYGEWANGTDWCPIHQKGNGRKYFCIYRRNHYGVHMNPVVGPWPQEERPVPTLKAGEDIAAGDPVALYPVDDFPCCSNGKHGYKLNSFGLVIKEISEGLERRYALKASRMARRPVTKP